jgi:hypothetical protein
MRREPDIQRKKYRTGLQNAKIGLQQPVAIHAQESDSVTRLDPDYAQRTRETGYTVCKLRIRKPLASAHDGGLAGVLLLGVAQESHGCKWNVHSLVSRF